MKSTPALIQAFALCVLLSLAQATAYAEIPINSDSDIAGSWLLEYSAMRLETKNLPRNETWIFDQGTLAKKGLQLPRGNTYDVPPVDYKIVDGKLSVAVFGRPEKHMTYELIERSGDKMILKGGGEGYHFFTRK